MNTRYDALRAAEDALESKNPWPDMSFPNRVYLHKVRKRVLVDLDFLLNTLEPAPTSAQRGTDG